MRGHDAQCVWYSVLKLEQEGLPCKEGTVYHKCTYALNVRQEHDIVRIRGYLSIGVALLEASAV